MSSSPSEGWTNLFSASCALNLGNFRVRRTKCVTIGVEHIGQVSCQIIQLVRFLSSDPCALCREMIDPLRGLKR
jgi:hypothetical protein